MGRPEDPRKVLRHRLAMMSITLDGDDRPPRARLVWSLVEHKGQPVDPDEPAYATGVDQIDPLTLAAIADLYGVPRGYLTAPGGDPGQEDRIDDDFFQIRTTNAWPRHARTYEPVRHAPRTRPETGSSGSHRDLGYRPNRRCARHPYRRHPDPGHRGSRDRPRGRARRCRDHADLGARRARRRDHVR